MVLVVVGLTFCVTRVVVLYDICCAEVLLVLGCAERYFTETIDSVPKNTSHKSIRTLDFQPRTLFVVAIIGLTVRLADVTIIHTF